MPSERKKDGAARERCVRPADARRWVARLLAIGVLSVGSGCGQPVGPATPQRRDPASPAGRRSADEQPADAAQDFGRRLDRALALGREFLLASQRPSGQFRYQVDLRTGAVAAQDDPVRQAGALWGLALIHRRQPTPETRAAVERGAAFFAARSRCTRDGCRFVRFPGYEQGASGTVALVALALLEFLQAEPTARDPWSAQLDEYLAFLRSLQRPDHRFYRAYLHSTGAGWGTPSPYYDGEILLALVRAATERRQDGDPPSRVLRAAAATDAAYVQDAIDQPRDDADTKGFFQWGCLAYARLFHSLWPGTAVYGPRTIALGHWMIDVHQVAQRPGNTAYACEGLVVAHQVAVGLGDQAAAEKFRRAIQQILGKLLTWQVGAAETNAFLRRQAEISPSCRGGVLSSAENPWLRIDMTQHQMHAILLARRAIWP